MTLRASDNSLDLVAVLGRLRDLFELREFAWSTSPSLAAIQARIMSTAVPSGLPLRANNNSNSENRGASITFRSQRNSGS